MLSAKFSLPHAHEVVTCEVIVIKTTRLVYSTPRALSHDCVVWLSIKFSLPLYASSRLAVKNNNTNFLILETLSPTIFFINISIRRRVLLNLQTSPLNDVSDTLV